MNKKTILFFIALFIITACGPNKEDMNKIKDFVIQSSSDLIHIQLKKGIKTKEFVFNDNKFVLQIDTTGKPVFIVDSIPANSMDFIYNEHKYEVILNKAEIKVRQIE